MGKWRLYKHHLGDYMRRWIFQTPWGTIHLHHILRSDGDRAFHDHPWNFTSNLLSGGYTELRPAGYNATTMRVWPRWSIVRRKATDLHRLILDKPVWTLVFTSKKLREWGFVEDGKWTHWREYEKRYTSKALT